jgi:hypothetical protein
MFKIKHLIRKKKKHLLKFFKITKNVVMFFFDNFSLVNILSSTHKKNDSKIHSFSFMASYILSIKKMIAKFILLVFFPLLYTSWCVESCRLMAGHRTIVTQI